MNVFKIVILLLLLTSLSYSKNTNTFDMSERNNYEIAMDKWHADFSDLVEETSNYVDDGIADFIYEDNKTTPDNNTSLDNNKTKKAVFKDNDKFFLSEKYLNEKRKGYVKFTPYTKQNTRSDFSDKTDYKIKARIPLHRFKKRFKVWWNRVRKKDKDSVSDANLTKEEKIKKMSYFNPDKYGIKQRYSLGVSSWYPLVRARYTKEWSYSTWEVELAQTFTYYTDDGFEEKTNLYFDTKFSNLSLFRVSLIRKTGEEYSGMDYGLGLTGFWRQDSKTGISLTQSFGGNTKYEYTKDEDEDEDPVEYKRTAKINKYYTGGTYRKNFYRKWLFYELATGVDFDIRNSYKPNYSVGAKIDVFFGRGYR